MVSGYNDHNLSWFMRFMVPIHNCICEQRGLRQVCMSGSLTRDQAKIYAYSTTR